MKGADAVICAIGSSGFNPKGPQTVDYEVSAWLSETSGVVCTCNNTPTYLVLVFRLRLRGGCSSKATGNDSTSLICWSVHIPNPDSSVDLC